MTAALATRIRQYPAQLYRFRLGSSSQPFLVKHASWTLEDLELLHDPLPVALT